MKEAVNNPALHPPPSTSCNTGGCATDIDDGGGGTMFGKFYIPEECIFYRTPWSVAFVNLRPIVPSHVLVIPIVATVAESSSSSATDNINRKTHLCDLTDDEYDDLWRTVRFVQTILQHHFHTISTAGTSTTASTDALIKTSTTMTPTQRLSYNVAVQDGIAAGQSVPHVHVHILPRITNDFVNNDDIYEELDQWEPRRQNQPPPPSPSHSSTTRSSHRLEVPHDQDRKDRTMIEMTTEAAIYRNIVADLLLHHHG